MRFSGPNVANALKDGCAVYATASPYDGVSAVAIDPDGRVRSLLPIPHRYHEFALAAEVGGRAMNLLLPSPGVCCAHGLVKREREPGWERTCGCEQENLDQNPERVR